MDYDWRQKWWFPQIPPKHFCAGFFSGLDALASSPLVKENEPSPKVVDNLFTLALMVQSVQSATAENGGGKLCFNKRRWMGLSIHLPNSKEVEHCIWATEGGYVYTVLYKTATGKPITEFSRESEDAILPLLAKFRREFEMTAETDLDDFYSICTEEERELYNDFFSDWDGEGEAED